MLNIPSGLGRRFKAGKLKTRWGWNGTSDQHLLCSDLVISLWAFMLSFDKKDGKLNSKCSIEIAKTRIKIMFQFSKLMDPSSYLCLPCTLSKVPCAIHSTPQVNMHHLHVHPWVILSTSHPCLQTFPEVRGFAWIWRTFSRSASQVAANLYHLTFHAW